MNTREYEARLFRRINPAVRFSVTRYVLSIGIFVAIVTFGVISILGLGTDLLPAVNIPSVNISTSYSGAGPGVIDQQVTQVIENAVSSMGGITDMSASSSSGSSRVTLSFPPGTDRNAAVNQVAALVNASIRRLPAGTGAPVVRTFDPTSQPIFHFGIAGGGASLTEVASYVQDSLVPTLERIDGVATASVEGAPSRQFQVLLDPARLAYHSITPAQVVNAIASSSVNQPIGSIISSGNSLTFSTRFVPEDLDHVARTLVDPVRGVAVADLGTLRDASSSSGYARINGMPVVLVSIQRATDSNSVAVVDRVRRALSSVVLPTGYRLEYGMDTTGPIRASIDSTWHELVISVLVVSLIVLLFLGKPLTALSVSLAIPVSLAASPILYNLAGFSFNLVSLLAMVIAIGIVVDNSIVVSENVERYRELGMPMKDAVLTGASEVFSAVVASTLSLVAVLLPVSFIGGFVGRYLQQFSLGLAAAVFFSLLESVLFMTVRLAYTRDRTPLGWKDFLRSFVRLPDAFGWGIRAIFKVPSILAFIAAAGALFHFRRFTWMPALLAWPVFLTLLNYALFMAVSLFESLSGTLHRATDVIVNLVRNLYARSLGPVLRLSAVVVVLCLAALVGISWFIVPEITFNFVPQADNGAMSVNVRFPPGTPQSVANQAAARVETYLLEREETTTVQVTVGGGVSTEIVLVPVGKRPSVFELAQTYRRELQPILRDIPSARLSVGTGGGGGGFGGSSLQLGIVSADFSLLQRRNAAIIGIVQENPWVADVGSSLSDINLQNDFIPDPARLRGTGLSPQTIATTLQTYTSGVQASNIVSGGIAYPLMVRLDPARITGGQTLLDLPIHSSALQANLQIGQLGRFVLTQSPVSLSRYNRQYIGNLSVNLRPGAPTALEMQKSLAAELAAAGLLDGGLSVTASSRSSSSALATELLTTSPQLFLLALFLSYLVMAGQFNSWRYPVYLLLPVPLAIVGALLVVWIVGGGIDIFGLMGMLMLIGLSSKSAILYLDFVMERMGRMDLVESLLEAAKLRFRPIVMTTVTTVAIAFPLVFARGQGAEFGQRMGIVMFGGIVFSTILTFYIVPAVFYLFERNRHASAPRPDRQDEAEPEVPGAPGRLPG